MAHPNPKSFCHAILQQFTKGLEDGGHVSEVVDLYAIRFDPVFRMQDFASYVHESMPLEILDEMNLKQHVLDSAGGPVQRFIAKRWLRKKDSVEVARFIHEHQAKGRYCPVGESEECPGPCLYCTRVLATLSRDPEGVVRTGLRLR